jgi:hypothetical protein
MSTARPTVEESTRFTPTAGVAWVTTHLHVSDTESPDDSASVGDEELPLAS